MTTAVSPQNLHPRRNPDREDDDNRYYDGVSFASDSYIPWLIGKLRLGKADLNRMRNSGVPVLRSHQPDNVVGRVMKVEKSGGLWRANWQLPKKPFNTNTFDAMDSSVLRGISVGGKLKVSTMVVDNPDETDWDDILLTCDWELIEQSLTSIPADTGSGIDRFLAEVLERDGQIFDTVISPEGIFTKDTTALRDHIGNLMRSHNEAVTFRRGQIMTTQAIPQEAIERAIIDQLERSEALKSLTDLPATVAKLAESVDADAKANMEYRAKLDKIQYQPNGQVLQLSNWNPAINEPLNIGRILRLTADREMGLPRLDPTTSTLEESFLERTELTAPDRSTAARIPFEAIMERSRQRAIQRSAMADAAGARPLQVNVLGNAGLLFNDYAPILSAMDVRMGLRGSQKVPYFTAQGTALGAAEAADIPITTYTMNNEDLLPVSIASAFDLSSSLQAADEGTFESLVDFAIFSVVNDEMVSQILDGGGSTANEIAGLWGRVSTATPDNVHEYGAAVTDFDRVDVLTTKNAVDLSKTDGGPGQWILGTGLYQLAENKLRGGASSERYLLEDGMMENRMVHHYKDFAPSGINDPGMFVKMDRCTVLVWGDSFQLQEIYVRARKNEWKLIVESNLAVVQPDYNLAAIRRT